MKKILLYVVQSYWLAQCAWKTGWSYFKSLKDVLFSFYSIMLFPTTDFFKEMIQQKEKDINIKILIVTHLGRKQYVFSPLLGTLLSLTPRL